jgi:glycosyltransferase involved in cell wall biosynthesis
MDTDRLEVTTGDGAGIAAPLWLTCTPKHFIGDAAHMARDTGLLSTGFKIAGYRSRPMLPSPACEADDPMILRVDPPEAMWDASYWKSLDADGVVLYAWGVPQYTGIAKAIKDAGLRLVVHLDSAGLMSPIVDGWTYSKLVMHRYRMDEGAVLGTVKGMLSVTRSMVPWIMDLPRLKHMAHGDLVGAVSPVACERIRSFARFYGREDIAEKVKLILHPISPQMRWTGTEKEKQICIVGRWTKSDWVKNPWLMAGVLGRVLADHPDYRAVVVGTKDRFVEDIVRGLPGAIRNRIELTGRLSNPEVSEVYATSRISICTSFSEGFHTSSAEAVCAGCSVVGYESPYLPNLPYFASENSGSIGTDGSPEAVAAAVGGEIRHWEEGHRDPNAISEIWSSRLHADKVATEIVRLTSAQG